MTFMWTIWDTWMYTLAAYHSAAMPCGIPLTQLRAEAVSSLLRISYVQELLNFILSLFPVDGQKSISLKYYCETCETCKIITKLAPFCHQFCILVRALMNGSNTRSYFRSKIFIYKWTKCRIAWRISTVHPLFTFLSRKFSIYSYQISCIIQNRILCMSICVMNPCCGGFNGLPLKNTSGKKDIFITEEVAWQIQRK